LTFLFKQTIIKCSPEWVRRRAVLRFIPVMAKALSPELPRDGRRKKMGDLFDLGHVAQLHEIQTARLRNSEPGIGHELDFPSFEKYLATIPKIPPQLRLPDKDFPLLVLVESRLPLKRLCACGNIDFDGSDKTFELWNALHSNPEVPFWIRMQDGRQNRNRSVVDCRHNFAKNELGLTVLEAVSAYIQYPEVVSDTTRRDGHVMDLPGSVRRKQREDVACLRVISGRTVLDWRWGGSALPNHGSASCRKF